MEKLNMTAMAERLGVSTSALSKAVKAGRVSPPDTDGCFDPVAAAAQWETNRHRRRRRDRAAEQPPAGEPTASGYWASRARREAAEAELAELKAAETRGDLVRQAAVVQEFGTHLINVQTALENLAARLAPVLAAEADLVRCQRLLRDEHRSALAAFVDAVTPPQEEGK